MPALPLSRNAQCVQSYFRHLPFDPADIACLALPEIIAEKIRACYQRSKARDIYDLSRFATRPLNQPFIRRLVVLKLWQAGDLFDPQVLMAKFDAATAFDWEDLRQLVRRTQAIDPGRITTACRKGFAFLAEFDSVEAELAIDPHKRKQALWRQLRADLRSADIAVHHDPQVGASRR